MLSEVRDDISIIDLEIHFEVQPQAARVEIRGADLRVVIVDVEHLAVHERRRLVVHLHAAIEQLPQHVPRGRMNEPKIVLRRQDLKDITGNNLNLLLHTGAKPVVSRHQLLTTIACSETVACVPTGKRQPPGKAACVAP